MSKAQEPLAYLVTGGRTYADRPFKNIYHAEASVTERKDGATIIPLYATPASSEQQSAQQDAAELAIGRAVNRACTELPEGWHISVQLENGAGTVYMTDWDGNEYDHFQSDDGFGDVINQAIDGAIAAKEVARASNGGKA